MKIGTKQLDITFLLLTLIRRHEECYCFIRELDTTVSTLKIACYVFFLNFISRRNIHLPYASSETLIRPVKMPLSNSADLDQTPHDETSDQGLHCLLKKFSSKIE